MLDSAKGRTFEDIAPRLPLETQLYVPKVDAVISLRENGAGLDSLSPVPANGVFPRERHLPLLSETSLTAASGGVCCNP